MPLVIEDGSGVAGANSYATVQEAKDYATARGLSLPADAAVEKALVLACDKLESYRFKGDKTDEANPLAWPRKNVYVGAATEPLADDSIPDKLKQAQCQLAYESSKGTDLMPTGTGREVVRTKVDVIETEYATRNSGTITPEFNKAEALLKPLLATSGSFGLQTVRV